MMTLPLDAAAKPAEVAALAGMMLGLGYTFAATSPFALGAVRDLSGGFGAVFWALSAVSAGLVVFAFSFSPARLAASRSLPGAG